VLPSLNVLLRIYNVSSHLPTLYTFVTLLLAVVLITDLSKFALSFFVPTVD